MRGRRGFSSSSCICAGAAGEGALRGTFRGAAGVAGREAERPDYKTKRTHALFAVLLGELAVGVRFLFAMLRLNSPRPH